MMEWPVYLINKGSINNDYYGDTKTSRYVYKVEGTEMRLPNERGNTKQH